MRGYNSGDDTFFGGFSSSESKAKNKGPNNKDILIVVSFPLERDYFWHLYFISLYEITYKKSNITTF